MSRIAQSHSYKLSITVLTILFSGAVIRAQQISPMQSVQYTQNTADVSLRGSLRVDPSTLGMSFSLTLGNYPGRGVSLPITINYSSKQWEVHTTSGVWGVIQDRTNNTALFANNSVSGWTSSLGIPQITFLGGQAYNNQTGGGLCYVCSPVQEGTAAFIDRMNITMPDGSRHELRQSDVVYLGNAPTFAGEYVAVDGSRMRYNALTQTLSLPDGSRYEMLEQNTVKYIDRNGNLTVFNMQTKVWTDTRGHLIPSPPLNNTASADINYDLAGVEGQTLRYVFKWRNLSSSGVLTTPAPPHYRGNRVCSFPQQTVSPSLFVSADPDNMCSGGLFDPVVLHQIVLPNNQAYTFTYNAFGEMDKVALPTGGYETFTYNAIDGVGSSLEESFYAQANRGVTEHKIHPDAQTVYIWKYSASRVPAGSNIKYMATEETPEGVYTERDMHRGGIGAWYGFDDPRAGMTYEERVYSARPNLGGTMLRRSLSKWIYTETTNPFNLHALRDPRLEKQVELMLDTSGPNALAMTKTMVYDNDLNVRETRSHDYVSINKTTAQTIGIDAVALGNLLRIDESLFLVNDESIANRAQYRARQMLALPTVSRVKDAAGTIVAEMQYIYDGEPLLTDVSAATWVDPGGIRGNVTKVRRWLNASADGNTVFACQPSSCANVNQPCLCTTGTWLETRSQYDRLGNPRNSWDAKNNLSQVAYAATFSHAYPTLTISPVPGGNSSASSLTASMSYDATTGKMLSSTDANGKTTTYFYRNESNQLDPLHRLQRVELPENLGKVKYEYNDTPGSLSIKTLTLQRETPAPAIWLEDTVFFDGLGRTFRSKHKEAANSSAKDTEYDQLSRVKRVSNPYFDTGAPAEWTTTTYDSLGRVIEIKTPDNAKVMTGYNGNEVTVTDQDGKQRRSVTDGLGRLIRVFEAPNLPSVNYRTDYTYDVLGNLTRVRQGGFPTSGVISNPVQFRSFYYDSLSRLMRVNNPEQDVNTQPGMAINGVSGALQWTAKYTYDANGNLLARTDARNLTANYSYDALNRNTQVSYTGGNTPAVRRFYDGAVNGLGRFQRVETDNLDPRNSGQAAYSQTVVNNYDALGRVTSQKQRFARGATTSPIWTEYPVLRSYDKAGHVETQSYPSLRNVIYSYNSGGRLSYYDGTAGIGAYFAYASDFAYNAAGQMTREVFGTSPVPLAHRTIYNNRFQMTEVKLGSDTSPGDSGNSTTWTRGKLVFNYGTTDNNGNVRRQEHFVPTEVIPSGAGPTSPENVTKHVIPMRDDYEYDALNRVTKVTGKQVNENSAESQIYTQAFSYDRFGNRKIDYGQTTGNNVNNRIYNPNPLNNRLRELVYDKAGNVLSETLYGSRADVREYDAENRMTRAASNGGGQQNYYVYDGDGRRVRRIVGSAETWQVYGIDGELLAEYKLASGAPETTPEKEYGYRNGQLLIVGEKSTAKVWWLVPDHLGTPRIEVDQTGSLGSVKRHDYLPFGEEVVVGVGTGSLRTIGMGYGASIVRQKFTGYERDDETGLDFAQARYYASNHGRFTNADPLMASARSIKPQSWNRYSYVLNNPLKLIDPSGLIDNDSDDDLDGDPQKRQRKEQQQRKFPLVPPVTTTVSTAAVIAATAVVATIIATIITSTPQPQPSPGIEINDGSAGIDEEKTRNDIYVFKPFKVRPLDPATGRGDIATDENGNVSPQNSSSFPQGKSFFGDPNQAPLTGPYYKIPKGTSLPIGTSLIPDGRDVRPDSPHSPTHHTLYPTVRMPFDTYNTLVLNFIEKNAAPAGKK